MASRHKWKDLEAKLSPDRRAKVKADTHKLSEEYLALQALRQSLNITQEELAELMEVSQHVVSKMENGHNMYISTLQRMIEALGGELKLVAHFPDRDVVINQFTTDDK